MNLMWQSVGLCQRLVGLSRAKRMVILGERLDALTLEAWGLIDEVCEPGDLKNGQWPSLSDMQRNPLWLRK